MPVEKISRHRAILSPLCLAATPYDRLLGGAIAPNGKGLAMLAATMKQEGAGRDRRGAGSVFPFEVAIDDALLCDLRERLNGTRRPGESGKEPAPIEHPEILIENIRAFFQPYRVH